MLPNFEVIVVVFWELKVFWGGLKVCEVGLNIANLRGSQCSRSHMARRHGSLATLRSAAPPSPSASASYSTPSADRHTWEQIQVKFGQRMDRRVFIQKAEAAAEANNGDVCFSRCNASCILCGVGGWKQMKQQISSVDEISPWGDTRGGCLCQGVHW